MTHRALSCAALTLCVATSGAAAASAFHRHGRPLNLPVSATFTLGAFEAYPGGLRFSGNPTLGGTPIPVSLRGAQLGLGRPRFVDAALHLDGDFHHVALGAVFGILLEGHPQSSPQRPADPSGRMTGFYTGPEAATVWTVKNVDLRAGFALGYRQYSFPLIGYDYVRCGKNGASSCQPSIAATGFFFRPSATLGGHFRGVSFGGYIAGDVMPGGGWGAGTYVGLESDAWHQRAAISP